MRNSAAFPKRGEVWLVNFNPGRGSEQRGIRPAVIIQNDVGNQFSSTTIVAAVTKTIKIYPVTVLLPKGSCGLDFDSMINLAQLLTIDQSRLMKRLGKLNARQLTETDGGLQTSLGLQE